MIRRGFTFYDWNASAGDATGNASKNTVLSNAISSVVAKNRAILLMHDSLNKRHTVAALPEVIDSLKAKGYTFDKLTNKIRPINFDYKE
jgi:peptidoglycan/xylan/chitin deacetylase (PgdA/CDA1 family)